MREGSYNDYARRSHAAATAKHKEWIKGLTTEQKAKLAHLGVLEPSEDHPEVDGHNP